MQEVELQYNMKTDYLRLLELEAKTKAPPVDVIEKEHEIPTLYKYYDSTWKLGETLSDNTQYMLTAGAQNDFETFAKEMNQYLINEAPWVRSVQFKNSHPENVEKANQILKNRGKQSARIRSSDELLQTAFGLWLSEKGGGKVGPGSATTYIGYTFTGKFNSNVCEYYLKS